MLRWTASVIQVGDKVLLPDILVVNVLGTVKHRLRLNTASSSLRDIFITIFS